MRFVQRHYPEVLAWRNAFRPPLPFEPGYFDMVYSVSVFSHLGPDEQRLWLGGARPGHQARRRLLPDHRGLHRPRQMRAGELPRPRASRRVALATKGLIFEDNADREAHKASERVVKFGSKYLGIDGVYGTTAMSPSYIRAHWTDFGFAVEAIVESVIDYRQDLVVLRRL